LLLRSAPVLGAGDVSSAILSAFSAAFSAFLGHMPTLFPA
jgi:hypothetical protein